MRRQPTRGQGILSSKKLLRYGGFFFCVLIILFGLGSFFFGSSSSSSSSSPSPSPVTPTEAEHRPLHHYVETVPPLSVQSGVGLSEHDREQQQQQNHHYHHQKVENRGDSDSGVGATNAPPSSEADQNDADLTPTVPGRLCALVLDSRPILSHRAPTPEENVQLKDVVFATSAAMLEFGNAKKRNRPKDATAFVFRPFADQPALPAEVLSGEGAEMVRQLEFGPREGDRVKGLKRMAPARKDEHDGGGGEETSSAAAADDGTNNNAKNTRRKSHSQSEMSFVEGVLRIIVAIEKLTKEEDCGAGLFVVNSVFSARPEIVDSVKGVIRTMLLHPAASSDSDSASSKQQQQQQQQKKRWVLTPLILSQNSRRLRLEKIQEERVKGTADAAHFYRRHQQHHPNIFSFGNDVVELYEGMSWPVPRFYGMPGVFNPAQTDTATDAPSGVFAFYTPAAVQALPWTIEKMSNTPRSRAGHAYMDKLREGFAVDVKLSAHHIFEVHLLACDAALAELAGMGASVENLPLQQQRQQQQHHQGKGDEDIASGKKLLAAGFFTLAVRETVSPLLFEEELISARYMLAVAHAATGLGSVHLHDNRNLTKALLAAGYGGAGDPLSKEVAEKLLAIHESHPHGGDDAVAAAGEEHKHHLQLRPHKLVRAPAPWVARVLPFLSSIASQSWYRFFGQHALPNLTLFWDPYCSCTGINVEAVNFLVPLERFVRTRAVADPKCWCPGFPLSDQFALRRMSGPKLLAGGSTSRFHIWVSHKPVAAFPEFPYDGAVQYGMYGEEKEEESGEQHRHHHHHHRRPDYVVGRTMIESDRIPQDWVVRLNSDPSPVDELWVPSSFLVDAFRKSGVRSSLPIHVIPEAIDINFYDPGTTPTGEFPHFSSRAEIGCKMPYSACTVFLSNFKWERRKGWDLLLRAYFGAFTADDNVVLVLKTYLYMDHEPYSVEKIRNRVFTFARDHVPNVDLHNLPKIWILSGDDSTSSGETPAFLMPRLYKMADVFVLPSRGEGWGLPYQEAMAMGLVTIGTAWSGMLDFMPRHSDGRTHFLINVTGLETAEGRPAGAESSSSSAQHRRSPPLFAAPDEKHLRELLVHVARKMSREERMLMGRAARFEIGQHLSRAAVSQMVLKRLSQIYKERHLGR